VRDRAADGAAVAHLRVADLPGRLCQQRHLAREQPGCLQFAVPGQRADRDVIAAVLDVGQARHPAEVDEDLRHGQAQLHQRQQ
jgi:hypothetical protein